MATVLYIQASPRGGRSKSIQVADAFINAYITHHPDDTVEKLNLFEADLPVFGADAAAAKFKIPRNQPVNPAEQQVWSQVEAFIDQFKAADKYVLATPMWNFSIPYRLKHYLDIIVQPRYTFTVTENGYEGLVTGKPLLAVYARGGAYPPGSAVEGYDMQIRYVEHIFGFMGFTTIQRLVVEPTQNQGEQAAQKAIEAALANARILAENF
jgi:FMN-dependent NADH-azoreductase